MLTFSPMTDAWFYSSDLAASETVVLEGREAKHAIGSRRLGEGDRVKLFDGHGGVAAATITNVDRRDSHMTVSIREIERREPLMPALHLACALPKGDRQSVLLNMATQLGMASFTPLLCERSVVKPGPSFTERAQRICIEACKQCHQPHCPVIHSPEQVSSVVDSYGASNAALVMLHPYNAEPPRIDTSRAAQIVILIGPEGGFTDAEVEAARRAGVMIRALGQFVMRTETAAIAALASCRFGATCP